MRPVSNPYNVTKSEIKRRRIQHKYQKNRDIYERLDKLEKEVVRLHKKVEHLNGNV